MTAPIADSTEAWLVIPASSPSRRLVSMAWRMAAGTSFGDANKP
jgi:hypothetical protein